MQRGLGLDVRVECWAMRSPFRICGKEFTDACDITVKGWARKRAYIAATGGSLQPHAQ